MYAININEFLLDEQSEYHFHLPDRQFFDWCAKKYSINRGVFNVIDNWFFEFGIKEIVSRRQVIDRFLNHLVLHGFYNEKKLFLQFGKGKLTESLHYFAERYLPNKECRGDFIDSPSK